jgi:MFS family permease
MLPAIGALRNRIRSSAAAFRAVVANPQLRRLELAWAFAIVGHWAYTIAVSVYAYDAGGSTAVGLVFAVRLFAAALVAPFAGLLADRYPRDLILLATTAARIALIGAAAVCAYADVEPMVVYALAVAAAIATAPYRPAQAALTPSLARTPEELTAANAVVSTVESIALFVGPALAGFLLAITSTGTVFSLNAGLLVVAAFFLARLRAPRAERRPEVAASTIASEALAGFRVIGHDRALRVLTTLTTAETLVLGALNVYLVVIAFELLDQGEAGVGALNSVIGIGALLGGVFGLSLAGARRLSMPFALGAVLSAAPLMLAGAWTNSAFVFVVLAISGAGSTTLDIAGFTLIQRAVSDEVLARVFGVIQMLWYLSLALGAALAPLLVDWLGVRGALVATGAFLLALVLLMWPQVRRIDATARPPDASELRLLSSTPIFAPLPGASLEHLAGRLVPLRLEPGSVIVRQGDPGDRFYIVAEGTVEVSEYGRTISELGPGGYFGEIALIRDVPRTATVTAKTDVVLYALDRDEFLAAVTSHQPSAEAAEEVVSARLAGIPVAGARIPTV